MLCKGGSAHVREARLLLRGEPVHLTPKVLETLKILLQNHGHIVEKEQLLAALWADSIVEEQNLTVHISVLRKILHQGSSQVFIETVSKRGYRFVPPVEEIDEGSAAEVSATSSGAPRRFPVVGLSVTLLLALLGAFFFVVITPASDHSLADRSLHEIGSQERQRFHHDDSQNVEAYELYLEGRYYWSLRTPEWIRIGIVHFEEAIEKDPNFALAYAGLADAYAISASGLPAAERFPQARRAARKALELNSELAEAHTALAFLTYKSDWQWDAAEASFQRAIELSPNYALAHHWYGELLGLLGRSEESIARLEEARELDPASVAIQTDLCDAYYRARRFDEAIHECRLATLHAQLGEVDRAFEYLDKSVAEYDDGPMGARNAIRLRFERLLRQRDLFEPATG